ncbi:glycosyltransferase family 4 protein [Corallococcus silvisoli]|uniref:glycosyltransferase family 4 protein n=1 Tax=Corallococcus silvisoli TaxID=2697031 RepID=UPI001378E9F5|nr:glycosyltransferase family 4 protein [Corallococcus silvisoli]NBD12954.1 glycosyltransferase [Corallococcus silvisoli]
MTGKSVARKQVVESGVPTSVLGMFFDAQLSPADAMVGGMHVAIMDFVTAMLAHGESQPRFFSSPGNVAATRGEVQRLLGLWRRPPDIARVEGYGALLNGLEAQGITHWHDITGEVERPFALRQAHARTLYPITVTPHVISRRHLLHSWFLQLLLLDVQPCDSVVCISPTTRDALVALMGQVEESFNLSHGTRLKYRGRFDVIPLGVDERLFQPRDRADMRHQLGLPQDAFILLWAGRIAPDHKADLLPLLRVFRQLVLDNPQHRPLLVLAGSGSDLYLRTLREHTLQLGMGDRVVMMSELHKARRHMYYAAADVFVSPIDSVHETFGLTPLEAMACGIPAVVSDWDGYRSTVIERETGFRIPTSWMRCDSDVSMLGGLLEFPTDLVMHLALAQSVAVDLEVLRDRLQLLMRNEALRLEMGRRARQHVVTSFSWKEVFARYEALWGELRARAARLPRRARRRVPPHTHPRYFDAFKGFATEVLTDKSMVKLGASGRALLAGTEPPPPRYVGTEPLHRTTVEQILAALARGKGKSATTGSVLGALTKGGTALSGDRARRQLMWLLKYGYLERSRRKG